MAVLIIALLGMSNPDPSFLTSLLILLSAFVIADVISDFVTMKKRTLKK